MFKKILVFEFVNLCVCDNYDSTWQSRSWWSEGDPAMLKWLPIHVRL